MTPFGNSAVRSIQNIFHSAVSGELRREIGELVRNQRLQPYFGAAFMLWLVGLVELIQKIGGQRLDPRFWMGIAVLITIYSGVRIFRLHPSSLGRAASKSPTPVEQLVSRMQSHGVAVYPSALENVSDGCVIVGPGGVYAVAVKARKLFGSQTIQFGKRNKLVLGGRISDSRPLRQAHTMAQKIGDQLRGVLRARISVKPLVVFLNDWRVDRDSAESDVAVMNEHELEQLLARQESNLTPAEIAAVSGRLSGLAPATTG
ncbi:MAG: nuclease-related domain-containing protein [Chthoniobacterales bacterium]